MIGPLVLAVALAGQAVESPPRVRIVSLPDSYAPDLVPGERLVPGSVYDVVRVGASYSRVQSPAPPASPQASVIPAPAAAMPYSSCYASSYGAGATSYPAQPPPVTYVIPSYRPSIQSTPMPACNCGGAQYAEPPPSARSRSRPRPRARMAFGLGVTSEWETRRRNEIHLGRYEGPSAIFGPERWSSGSR